MTTPRIHESRREGWMRRPMRLAAVVLAAAVAWTYPAPGQARGNKDVSGGMVPPYVMDRWPGNAASSVVTYPDGRYELRGDGVSVPYHWVWVPLSGPPPVPVPPPPRPGTPQ